MTDCPTCAGGGLCLRHGSGVYTSTKGGETITVTVDKAPCSKCGEVHTRCSAHARTGRPCGQSPKAGGVCWLHGGNTPQVREKARRAELEAEARVALEKAWEKHGEVPVRDPLGELARLAGEVVAFKDMLRAQVESLNGTLTYWQEQDFHDADGEVAWTKAAEDARAVVVLYERAQQRAGTILTNMVKLDIAGRMLELRTAQAVAIVDAVRTGLSTVDMAAEVRKAAENAIADALGKITEPAPPKGIPG